MKKAFALTLVAAVLALAPAQADAATSDDCLGGASLYSGWCVSVPTPNVSGSSQDHVRQTHNIGWFQRDFGPQRNSRPTANRPSGFSRFR